MMKRVYIEHFFLKIKDLIEFENFKKNDEIIFPEKLDFQLYNSIMLIYKLIYSSLQNMSGFTCISLNYTFLEFHTLEKS